jgi:hypothetical protein
MQQYVGWVVEDMFRGRIWQPPPRDTRRAKDSSDVFLKTISGARVHMRLVSATADQNNDVWALDLFCSTDLEGRSLTERLLEKIQNYLTTRGCYPTHTARSWLWRQIMAERDEMYQSIYSEFVVQTAGTIN